MLDLNDQGFVGKPLSYDTRDAYNSSRWAGQLPNGDWVVGLFNRESYPQKMSVDFTKELGITTGMPITVRDLWSHTNLEIKDNGYTTELGPHECRIIKIQSAGTPKYEAEVASMIGGAKKNNNHKDYNGPGFVDNFENIGTKVLFALDVPFAGEYILNARYANASGTERTASIYINEIKVNGSLIMPNLSNWNEWQMTERSVTLKTGINLVAIQYDTGDNGRFNLDYIQVHSNN